MPLVTSRQNPIVSRFREAARRESGGTILLDGPHLVTDALEAGLQLREVAVENGADARPEIRVLLDRCRARAVTTSTTTAAVMAALSPVRSASPIVAIADEPTWDVTHLYRSPALIVVAVDVQDPGNLGAIVRVAEAGGATGVICAGASADPFGWKALRGSMGSSLRLPLERAAASVDAINDLRRRGCRIVATVPRGGRVLTDSALTDDVAILVGGEGHGLSAELVAAADEQVTIPMQPPVESLNAAVTAALLVYEARRQREPRAVRDRASRHTAVHE